MDPRIEPQLEADDPISDITEKETKVREALNGKGARAYLTPRQRISEIVLAAVVILAAIGTPTLLAVRATTNSNEAALRLFCPAWGDIASAPVAPDSKPLGIAIVGDARIAYEGAQCDKTTGVKLLPAVPAVAEYINKKAHR